MGPWGETEYRNQDWAGWESLCGGWRVQTEVILVETPGVTYRVMTVEWASRYTKRPQNTYVTSARCKRQLDSYIMLNIDYVIL